MKKLRHLAIETDQHGAMRLCVIGGAIERDGRMTLGYDVGTNSELVRMLDEITDEITTIRASLVGKPNQERNLALRDVQLPLSVNTGFGVLGNPFKP